MAEAPEAWLGGPIDGVEPLLMPVAHALVQARADLSHLAADLTTEELWQRPGGAAPVGFHLRHVAGVLDRLLTYARGETIGPEQLRALEEEAEAGSPPADAATLLRRARAAIDGALEQVRATKVDELLAPREVGRRRLPSNVLGLLSHAAEHVTRHTGQAITTFKVLRGAARPR